MDTILLFMLPAGLWAQDAGVAATTAAPDATAGALGELATGLNTVWMLLAAMLVFFMQPGFALVEAGFTRVKNTANILMKNFVDFMFGSLLYWFIGFGLMFGAGGFIGMPHFFDLSFYDGGGLPTEGFLVFQTVFCATAATIVSGAMAERTKFSMYLVYTIFISVLIYPVSGHWTWGGGWLMNGEAGSFMMETFGTTFHDFAGSTIVHSVGGWIALVGAAILGPRIGKYGKDGKPKAILGHSLTLGALGVFILWFCWFGFNGCSTVSATGDESLLSMSNIFVTTNLSAAVATVAVMIITWVRYKKPDVSMTLNGSLAGLVAVTAGCDMVNPFGAACIGLIAGFVVVFGIEFIDKKLKIDDPVGAIGVHGLCGATGTLLTGLFAVDGGVFYGGGFSFLGVQALGVVSVIAWVTVMMVIIYTLIKKTIGLRVSPAEEIAGLDVTEHGLASSYADFMPTNGFVGQSASVDTAIPVEVHTASGHVDPGLKMTKVAIVANRNKFEALNSALNAIGVTGMTVTQVMGCGVQKGHGEFYRGVEVEMALLPKIKVEVVVSTVPVETVIQTAKNALFTGHIGDGKIFVYDVENVVKIRTGEEGPAALQDED